LIWNPQAVHDQGLLLNGKTEDGKEHLDAKHHISPGRAISSLLYFVRLDGRIEKQLGSQCKDFEIQDQAQISCVSLQSGCLSRVSKLRIAVAWSQCLNMFFI
jgi:hypothetical protein